MTEKIFDMCKYEFIGSGMMGQEYIRNIAPFEHARVTAIYEPDTAMRTTAKMLVPNAIQVDSLADLLVCRGSTAC